MKDKKLVVGKTLLAAQVANAAEISRNCATQGIDLLVSFIQDYLRRGTTNVCLPGLGTFSVAEVAERQFNVMATGETITIPAHRKVRFKPAEGLLDTGMSPRLKK